MKPDYTFAQPSVERETLRRMGVKEEEWGGGGSSGSQRLFSFRCKSRSPRGDATYTALLQGSRCRCRCFSRRTPVVWSIGLTTGHETPGTGAGAGAGSLETRSKAVARAWVSDCHPPSREG